MKEFIDLNRALIKDGHRIYPEWWAPTSDPGGAGGRRWLVAIFAPLGGFVAAMTVHHDHPDGWYLKINGVGMEERAAAAALGQRHGVRLMFTGSQYLEIGVAPSGEDPVMLIGRLAEAAASLGVPTSITFSAAGASVTMGNAPPRWTRDLSSIAALRDFMVGCLRCRVEDLHARTEHARTIAADASKLVDELAGPAPAAP